MAITSNAPEAEEQVLSTLNQDGSRRLIRPKPSKGRFYRRRLVTASALIATFTLIPVLRMGGKPLILLDIPRREFVFFGRTFLPTDTFLLMLMLFSIFVGIFLLTALLGRVWCGWACPQTVYMEYLYRPLERWIEGGRTRQLQMDREGPSLRQILKHAVFFVISAFLANTFLGYFVGWDRLIGWMTKPPTQHPGAFGVMLVTSLLMFLDFAWFREQTCIVACPYGRFQSVLLDRQSLIVGYDPNRGEPRARWRRNHQRTAGDCIDCHLCVSTCPTGIDIRAGLQMECIACTQCLDACDEVMDQVLPSGEVSNQIRIKIANRSPEERAYLLEIVEPLELTLVAPENPLVVGSGDTQMTAAFINAPRSTFTDGELAIVLRIGDGVDFERDRQYRLLGPSGG